MITDAANGHDSLLAVAVRVVRILTFGQH